eukprot:TRINITY_DN368_c0_g3_i1.p1 TRINITY_DN368_c0_g3~~TRINITY_DN368_c0_g3_i1.p1  ORF type:complete len:743 (+),score=220.02 TRINITY_DN368_c0_g3_i1:70-2298(+)
MAVKVLQACVLVAALAVGGNAACTPSTKSGFKCQSTESIGTVHYEMSNDKSKVKFAAEASVTGYVALGVGNFMTSSKIVLGYVANGQGTMHAYDAIAGRNSAAVQSAQLDIASTAWVSDYSVVEANGKTTTSFTYTISGLDTASVPMVAGTSSSDSVIRHSNRLRFTLNLDEAQADATTTTAPQPTPVPTPQPTPVPTPQPTPAPSCTASTLSAYSCQQEASVSGGTMTVHWKLTADLASVSFAVVAPGTGWVGLGFGTGMVPADAVIATSSGVKVYKLESRSLSGVVASTAAWFDASSASMAEAAGVTTLKFTRTTSGLNLGAVDLIVAYHSTSDTLARHTGRGKLQVQLQKPSTNTPTPPAPATTQTPSTQAPSCTRSTLEVQGGTGTYECVADVGAGLKLHWTLAATRLFALEGTAAGYLAMGFPESPGSMGPGAALIATAAGVQKYRIGGGKSLGDVNVDTTVLPLVGGLGSATVSGSTVLFWTEAAAASGRQASVQQSGGVLQFNYALHSSSNNLEIHTTRGSADIDLASASVTDTSASSKQDEVKTHAGILVTVWCFLVPFGILAKRFLPLVTTAKVGSFPVPFVLHAALMFIAIVLTIAMVGLALDQFESGTEKSHKEIGIVVLVGCILQLVMQAAKCDGESEHRWIFRAVHIVLGFATLALSMAQIYTGADNYERIYANDSDFAEDIRHTALAGLCVFFVAFVALSVLQLVRGGPTQTPEEPDSSPTAPDDVPK